MRQRRDGHLTDPSNRDCRFRGIRPRWCPGFRTGAFANYPPEEHAATISGMSAETVFGDLAAELAAEGATTTTLFGGRAITWGRKILAILDDDRIVLRLASGSPEHTDALRLPGAQMWHPPGRSKPYRDWVSVLVEENTELEDTEFTELARAAVRSIAQSPA